jgi:hypothetical protein
MVVVEEFYFRELQKVLVEIRDEMRKLREALEPLVAHPQQIVFNAEPPGSSSSFVELQAYFDEWAKKSYGS